MTKECYYMPNMLLDPKHFALLSESVEVELVMNIEINDLPVSCDIMTPIKAGVYGFTSIKKRDTFIAHINRLSPDELASRITLCQTT